MSQFPFNLQDFDIQPLKWFNNFFFTTTHIPTTTCLFHLISFFFFQAGGGNNRDKLLAEAFWQMDACNSISKLLATSSNDLWKRPCPKAFVNFVTKMGHFPHFPKSIVQYFRQTITVGLEMHGLKLHGPWLCTFLNRVQKFEMHEFM